MAGICLPLGLCMVTVNDYLKNCGNSHWSHEPRMHCHLGIPKLFLIQPITKGQCPWIGGQISYPTDIPTADRPRLCSRLLYQPAVFEYWLSTYGKLTHPHARHCPRRFSFPCIIDWDRSSCSPVTWNLQKCVLKFSMTPGCMSVAALVLAMFDFKSFGISWSKIFKFRLRIFKSEPDFSDT